VWDSKSVVFDDRLRFNEESLFDMLKVTEDEKFLFDLQGFLILREAIDRELVEALDRAVVENEGIDHDESWAEGLPVVTFGHLTKDTNHECQVRLNGLPRLDPIFDRLIAHPAILPYLHEFMGEPQLVNTWSISKYEGSEATSWHNGIPPYEYTVRDGMIRSPMVNVVIMLTPNHPGDGCFAIIPGSHKKNFELERDRWRLAGLDTPASVEVTGDPGDVIIFTEALVHSGSAKTTARRRTTLQYNHVHSRRVASSILDHHNARHYWMPPSIRQRFTAEQKELTSWMNYTIPDRSIPGAKRSND
jgi:ectoine hydroxylase-related dioxygenase (phytanoyl-CoA dioxygenase family)